MSTETGSDEEEGEDEDEDEDQMYVNGMRGRGKKKFLFCVFQASSVPWDWNGIQGILMVERIYESERTRAFKVFQLSLDGKDWKLIMKEDLGDIALFVGGSSTFALAASSVSGCLANHIYFLQDSNGIARRIHGVMITGHIISQ